jgi:hypothetical protein
MSESDALGVDSGFSESNIEMAETAWANLPTGRKWTSLATHEKALVIHTLTRLSSPPPAVGGEVERLSQIASDMEDAVAHGMSWISHSECYDFTRRIRNVVEALTPQGGQKP